jgi:hypothetical protein
MKKAHLTYQRSGSLLLISSSLVDEIDFEFVRDLAVGIGVAVERLLLVMAIEHVVVVAEILVVHVEGRRYRRELLLWRERDRWSTQVTEFLK